MEKKPLPPAVCEPRYHIGSIVNYTDHRGNPVQGKILSALCEWDGRGNGADFTLKYAITHPTNKRNERHTAGDIHGEVE